jgi:hypothetical protein
VNDANRAVAHCPVCGAEYRAGFEVCADDGTPLERGPAPERARSARTDPIEPEIPRFPSDDPATELGRWPPVEADLLVAKLRSQGVDAFDESQFPGFPVGWHGVTELFLCRVWVKRSEVRRAQEIVRRTLAGEDAI